MKHTVVGRIASADGLAADFSRRRGAWASPAADYRTAQPQRIPVDRDHNHQWVGRIVHLERGPGGIVAVAELDISEPALIVRVADQDVALRDPTYFSAEYDSDPDGRDIELISVAVVHRTACLSATPLHWFEGDLGHRSGWPTDTFHRPLLNRAAETSYTRHGGPIVIHGHTGDYWQSGSVRSAPQPGPPVPSGLLLRNAQTVDVRPSRREIELVVMPYEVATPVPHPAGEPRMVHETISRTAFHGIEHRHDPVRVNRDHDLTRTVGRATQLDSQDPRGLIATIKIANTPLGDETLALAADDCLDASAGFRPRNGGMQWQGRDSYRVNSAFLGHIALTPDPAYSGAKVLAVRAGG